MVDKFRKIFFVFAIVAISLMGMPVHTAKAATVSAGSLIKASGAAVYYYASNGKRFVFPNEKTYKTWFSDFSSVVTITDAELAAIQIGGNIVYRPGTRLVKITTDPKVYAVSAHGTLHWITSEAIANQLYGATWNQMIDDVSDAFFTNYTYGADITSAVHPNGAQIKYAGSANIYVIEGGEKRLIADAASYSANRFNSMYVMNIADTITYTSAATSLAAAEVRYTDVAQLWGSSTPVVTGNLNVTVASDTPASTTIPQGAVGVAVAKFTFTAGPNAVTINGLTLSRSGLGQATEIAKVYLYNGDAKLSSGRTINTSTNTVNFTNLNLNVPANGSVTVTVKVDVGTAALGGTHRFGVAGVGDVTSTASVGGIFPVNANEFAISTAVTVGKADIESNGTNYTRKVGETEVEVANFTVYVNNVENGKVESVTLYNSGRDILNNLKLYRGTTLVATATKNGNYFTFNLTTPFEIAKSESAQFIVKGDVSGREGDAATLAIRYKTDVRVKGMTYGYALDIDAAINTGDSYVEEVDNSPQSNTTTAEAGQLTAAFNGPVTGDVAKNTTNVVLMNFSLTAQAAVDVEKSTINISGTDLQTVLGPPAIAEIDDLKLVCNNVVVAEWSNVTVGDNVSTDVWNLPAGGVNCQVRIDVLNTTAGNETIRATLKSLTGAGWTFKDAATGDALTDIVPSGDIAGNEMSITAASLTVDLASSPSSGNVYVPRSADASMVAFLLTAGAASDVKVTSMKLAAYLDDDQDWDDAGDYNQSSGAKDILSTVKLYNEEGSQIGTTKTLVVGTADITATFDNLNFVIPAGTTKKVLVKADISSTAPMSADDYVAFALSTITAEYGTGGTSLAATVNADNSDDASVLGTTPSVYQTVTTNGDLTVSLHADTPVARLLPMNTGSLQVLRIKLAATKENITLNDLAIEHISTATPGNESKAYNEFASATIGSKTAYFVTEVGPTRVAKFTGLNINVPADGSTFIDVLVRTNDRWSAQNYDELNSFENTFNVSDSYYKNTTAVSGVVDTFLGGGALSKKMYVFEAYPTFAINKTNGTLVANADFEVGNFTITANGGKDVSFTFGSGNYIIANIQVGGTPIAAATTVTFKADGNILCTATPTLVVGSNYITCNFATNPLTIAQGSSKVVRVYVNTQASGLGDTTGDSVSVSLNEGASRVDWGIDGVGSWGDAVGSEITNILFSGNLVGGTYSVNP
jgi:hypothetical protein